MTKLKFFPLPLGIKIIVLIYIILISFSLISPPRNENFFIFANFIVKGWKVFWINLFFLIIDLIWIVGLIRLKKFARWIGIIIGSYYSLFYLTEVFLVSEERFFKARQLLQRPVENILPEAPIVLIGLFFIPLTFYVWLVYYHYSRKQLLSR